MRASARHRATGQPRLSRLPTHRPLTRTGRSSRCVGARFEASAVLVRPPVDTGRNGALYKSARRLRYQISILQGAGTSSGPNWHNVSDEMVSTCLQTACLCQRDSLLQMKYNEVRGVSNLASLSQVLQAENSHCSPSPYTMQASTMRHMLPVQVQHVCHTFLQHYLLKKQSNAV